MYVHMHIYRENMLKQRQKERERLQDQPTGRREIQPSERETDRETERQREVEGDREKERDRERQSYLQGDAADSPFQFERSF